MVNFSYQKLNNSEIKKLLEKLSFFYGSDTEFLKKFYFYINNKGKVHISPIEVNSMNFPRINSIGLYFGTFHDGNRFRLSIEGSQILTITKNYIELSDENLKSYITGESLFLEEINKIDYQDECPFLVVKYKGDNIGVISIKDKELLNYVSKGRRLDFNRVF